MSTKNHIFLVPQQGSSLDLLWGEESQLLQMPVAFNTPFFPQVTIEKLIQTLKTADLQFCPIYKMVLWSPKRYPVSVKWSYILCSIFKVFLKFQYLNLLCIISLHSCIYVEQSDFFPNLKFVFRIEIALYFVSLHDMTSFTQKINWCLTNINQRLTNISQF